MNRALRICRKVGCTALVASGFCERHQYLAAEIQKERYKILDANKTPESKKFYSSQKWTDCSKMHRIKEPLCRKCKEQGYITIATLTHHNPPMEVLIAQGKDPFDDKYLESLCFRCHQKEK